MKSLTILIDENLMLAFQAICSKYGMKKKTVIAALVSHFLKNPERWLSKPGVQKFDKRK